MSEGFGSSSSGSSRLDAGMQQVLPIYGRLLAATFPSIMRATAMLSRVIVPGVEQFPGWMHRWAK